jgi:hypothetical protein
VKLALLVLTVLKALKAKSAPKAIKEFRAKLAQKAPSVPLDRKARQEYRECKANPDLLAHKARLVLLASTVWQDRKVRKESQDSVCDLLQESQQSTTFQPQQTKVTYILSKPPATHGFGMKQSQHS